MRYRNSAGAALAFLFLFVFVSSVYAQGIIIPRPCPIQRRCPRPIPRPTRLPVALPVKSIEIDAKVVGQVATTRVVQVFRNDSPYVLEGTYFFPIPEDASVEGFAIWENGKKLTGEVRSRKEARRIYNEIVRKMKDPGLLEYAGRDLFQASIFPIPAYSDKKLELVYSQILKADSGTVSYSYPLGTGKSLWARRNVIFDERRRDRPTPPVQRFGTVSGKIEIRANEALRNIYSPSHAIEVNKKTEKRATVSFETKGNPDDFRLFYGLSDSDFGMSLVTYREPGKDGYFLLMLSPSPDISRGEIVKKDVIFVLDTSGSMQAAGKLVKARPALLFGVRGLNEGDRFNVINFSGEEHLMESGLVDADDGNKKKAETFAGRLRANGGTNINDALAAALDQFDSTSRPKMLVLLTDGLPTVGIQDVDKIIENVKRKNVKGLRLFPFGVGYDVNTRLLDSLGRENAGVADYIQPTEDLEVKVSNFFSKVNSPVLSDVKLDFGGLRPDLMYPRTISDIFRGSQLVIIGRYRNSSDLENISIRLTGKTGMKQRTFRYNNLEFPLRSTKNDFLPRLWASRRVGWLIEQIRLNGESKEIKDEIVDLGTRYGIVTPYTSYLATDGTFRARETAGNRFMIDPAADAAISMDLRKEKGRGAVKRSVQQNALQSNVTVSSAAAGDENSQVFLVDTKTNRFVGTKNFINDNGRWVDTAFSKEAGLPETVVRFGSEEYFDLAISTSGLGRYLAIGKNVTIVWKGRVYNISE